MTTIRCPLCESSQISGKNKALIREGLELSYKDFEKMVISLAANLEKKGFQSQERIGIFLQNDWMYPVLLMSLFRIGAIACPLSTRLPKEKLKNILRDIRCEKIISTIKGERVEKTLWGIQVFDPDGLFDFNEEVKSSHKPTRYEVDRPSTIIYTSGSSGCSKPVLHSLGNHYYSAKGANVNIRLSTNDRWLVSLPFYHVSGLSILFRCLLSGAAMILAPPQESLDDSILTYKVTHLSIVTTQLITWLEEGIDEAVIKQLKAVLIGGGPIPPQLVLRAKKLGLPIYSTYGLTEMASQVTTTRIDTPPHKRTTSGKLLKYREVMINKDREVLVRGDTMALGYVQCDELILPVDNEGWFHTGDLGEFDVEGYLTIIGRKDSMFISGGENIYPEEIEKILVDQIHVQCAVVVPVPDRKYGHTPVAFLKPKAKRIPNEEFLREQLEQRLPRFKIPRKFFNWPTIANEGSLKFDRQFFTELAQSQSP